MCNKDIYRYNEDNLYGSFPVFGAMIRPKNQQDIAFIAEKLGNAQFACMVRNNTENDEDGHQTNCEKLIMLMMNPAYKDLLTKLGFPTVPSAAKLGSFYDLVVGNYDFMINGHAEGLILVAPSSGPAVQVSKWKIGAERNS